MNGENLCNMSATLGNKEFKAAFLGGELVVFHEGKRYEVGKLLEAFGLTVVTRLYIRRQQDIIAQLNKGLKKYKRKYNDVLNKYIGIKSFLSDYWVNTDGFKAIEKYGRQYKEKFINYTDLEYKEKVLKQKEQKLKEQETKSSHPVLICGSKITEKELLDLLKQMKN